MKTFKLYATPYLWLISKYIAKSPASKALSLIPVIGYFIIFSEQIQPYLNLVDQIESPLIFTQSLRIGLIYWGSLFIAIGMVIFFIFAPQKLRQYESAHQYGIQLSQISSHMVLQECILDIFQNRRKLEMENGALNFKKDLKSFQSAAIDLGIINAVMTYAMKLKELEQYIWSLPLSTNLPKDAVRRAEEFDQPIRKFAALNSTQILLIDEVNNYNNLIQNLREKWADTKEKINTEKFREIITVIDSDLNSANDFECPKNYEVLSYCFEVLWKNKDDGSNASSVYRLALRGYERALQERPISGALSAALLTLGATMIAIPSFDVVQAVSREFITSFFL